MNFRSCKYFLTVCEMGTINAAARKLYISQQSLSQHIRRMEEEVGAQLFHRDNPLVLTEAGKCVQRAAQAVLAAMEQMDREIAACRGAIPKQLTIGLLDYGTPEFLPPIIDLFLKKDPDVALLECSLSSRQNREKCRAGNSRKVFPAFYLLSNAKNSTGVIPPSPF